jgi:ABC-type glutathione transport system ATPase component
MPDPIIVNLKDVTKQYQPGLPGGVKEINLEVQRGKTLAIVGESGSGKTTLLKLIYGLLAPDSGSITFNHEHVLGPHEKLIPGHDRMKMVSQDFDLNLYSKVHENIGGMLSNTDLELKRGKTLEIMRSLRIDNLENKRAVDLSGGEQQRVAIARAFIASPDVLLLDEPFSQVDALLKHQLRADVKQLAEETGITIIIVSHDPSDGLSLADEMVILKEGRILESGKPSELYDHPQHLYTAQLLANCNILAAEDARLAGIRSGKKVVIYPEWIELRKSWRSKKFIVKDIILKGFYKELLLEREHLTITALNINSYSCEKGDKVPVVVKRYLEFDED